MTVTAPLLSPQQLDTYQREGVLVVENVLNKAELEAARSGLTATLQKHGVDPHRLATTGHHLASLSSTGGSGGVLDVFYEDWQIAVATNEKFFRITTELWRAAYSYRKEDAADAQNGHLGGDPQQSCWQWHPYGPFDCDKGYLYLDRIGYRIPTALAEQLGTTHPNKNGANKKKKTTPIQRSLTPHLDCCPDKFFDEDNPKWRPIQSFISLSDSLDANHGGFEVARGFHRDFAHWAAHRPPTVVVRRKKAGPKHQPHETYQETTEIPAPCVGSYTHIRPKEDAAVLQRVRHVPVPAGSAVFWDNRLPHANAYRHVGTTPRAVVYGSFLPDVLVNRTYAARQLQNWKRGRNPTDQWIVVPDNNGDDNGDDKTPGCITSIQEEEEDSLLLDQQRRIENVLSSPLARKLAGVEPW